MSNKTKGPQKRGHNWIRPPMNEEEGYTSNANIKCIYEKVLRFPP